MARVEEKQISEEAVFNELSERYQRIAEEGVVAEELVFQFKCQNCGFRCCSEPHIGTVESNPYSLAYIRKKMTQKEIAQLFDLNKLKWVVNGTQAPKLVVTGNMCPFLIMFWGKNMYELYQYQMFNLLSKNTEQRSVVLVFTMMMHKLKDVF